MTEQNVTIGYLVKETGYEHCTHLGYFTDRKDAEAYAKWYRRCTHETVSVEECVADVPRRELEGAYVVELTPVGEVEMEGWVDYVTPDKPEWNDNGVTAAHWWGDGSGVRAAGINRKEAMERARGLLRRTPTESEATP